MLEGELQPGGGSTWHPHTLEEETIVVVEGTLVVFDGEGHDVGAGDAHVLRRHVATRLRTRRRRSRASTSSARREGLSGSFRDLANGTPPDDAAKRAGLKFG